MPQDSKSKNEYQQKIELELKIIKTHIIELEKEIQKREASIRVRHNQKMGQIRGHYAQTKEKLNELRTSTQGNWLELKTALDEDISLLDEAVEIISQRVSAPIEK